MWERLWRRTVTLAREHPALWLPVIFADLAGFSLRVNKLAVIELVDRLFHRMFPRHSVLIGTIGDSPNARTLSFAAAVLISFVVQSAPVVLYTVAYFVTARMVWGYIGFESASKSSHAGRNMIALSIRGLLVGCVAWIAIGLVSVAYLRSRWHAAGLPRTIFAEVLVAVLTSGFAYVMVPPAMRLLAEPTEPLNKRSIRLGRKCAIAAVTASTGLLILESIVIGIMHGTHAEMRTIQAIGSLVAALPYAPLYIALSLLARDEQTEVPRKQTALVPREA
jgi:hypothetical protein